MMWETKGEVVGGMFSIREEGMSAAPRWHVGLEEDFGRVHLQKVGKGRSGPAGGRWGGGGDGRSFVRASLFSEIRKHPPAETEDGEL